MLAIGSFTSITFVLLLFKWLRKKQPPKKVLLQDPNLKYEVKLIDKEVCLRIKSCSITETHFFVLTV